MRSRSDREARNTALQARPRDINAFTASPGAGAGTGSTAYQRPSIGMSRSTPRSYDPDYDDEDDEPEPYHPLTPSDYVRDACRDLELAACS